LIVFGSLMTLPGGEIRWAGFFVLQSL